jgi:hypothetical protein
MFSQTKPTIGRKLWLYISTDKMPGALLSNQPLDATVVHVNEDGTVNLCFFTHNGNNGFLPSIPLYDPKESDSHMGGGNHYATWMPYQAAQAKKQLAEKVQVPGTTPE